MVAPRGSENLLAPPSLRPLGLVHGSARWGRALVDVFFFAHGSLFMVASACQRPLGGKRAMQFGT